MLLDRSDLLQVSHLMLPLHADPLPPVHLTQQAMRIAKGGQVAIPAQAGLSLIHAVEGIPDGGRLGQQFSAFKGRPVSKG